MAGWPSASRTHGADQVTAARSGTLRSNRRRRCLPDGAWLAFASDESGRWEIYVRALPDGRPIAVSSGGGERPVWSADGRSIYFEDGARVMRAPFAAIGAPRRHAGRHVRTTRCSSPCRHADRSCPHRATTRRTRHRHSSCFNGCVRHGCACRLRSARRADERIPHHSSNQPPCPILATIPTTRPSSSQSRATRCSRTAWNRTSPPPLARSSRIFEPEHAATGSAISARCPGRRSTTTTRAISISSKSASRRRVAAPS